MSSTSSHKSREGSHGWLCFLASFCSSSTKFRNTVFSASQDPWFDLAVWYLGFSFNVDAVKFGEYTVKVAENFASNKSIAANKVERKHV